MDYSDLCWMCDDKKHKDTVFCLSHLMEKYSNMEQIYRDQHNPTFANWYRDQIKKIRAEVAKAPWDLLE